MSNTRDMILDNLIYLLQAGIDDRSYFESFESSLFRVYPHITVRWLNQEVLWFSVSIGHQPTRRGYNRVVRSCHELNLMVLSILGFKTSCLLGLPYYSCR
uniref:Uncharacterized protein n=1 Tax=Leviviridae sp. TaxID=2027243 RepID=A0A514D8G5_9VIRU|nr:MAG: hypothetical protein H1Bulk30641_000004 [Leviviridae sp.]